MRNLISRPPGQNQPRQTKAYGRRECALAAKAFDSLPFADVSTNRLPATPPPCAQAYTVALTTKQFSMAQEVVRAQCELQWKIASQANEGLTLLRSDPGCPRELIHEAQRRYESLMRAATRWDELLHSFADQTSVHFPVRAE